MKKLTKKNFQKLCETMVVLGEAEQRNYVGAAFYYSPDGELLGNLGNTSEIRVVSSDIFYSLNDNNDDACLIGNSTPIYYSESNTQAAIINSIASQLGLDYIYVEALHDKETGEPLYDTGGKATHNKITETYTDGSTYTYYESYITINSISKTFEEGNMYDMKCMLVHEQDHCDKFDPKTYNENESELSALRATINSEYFEHASSEFREKIQAQHDYYYELCFGNNGYYGY